MNDMTMGPATVLLGDCVHRLRQVQSGSVQTCVTSPPYFGLRDYGHGGQIGLESTPDEYIARLVAVFREVRRVLADDGTLWVNIGDTYANSGGRTAVGKTSQRQGRANISSQNQVKGYAGGGGIKTKDLIGIPWMLAFALRADGWYLRQDIIWHKPNPMPESVRDRCTKAHEYVFLLSKSAKYFYDYEAVKEPAISTRGPGNIQPVRPVPNERDSSDNANLRGSLHKIGMRETRNRRSVWTVSSKPYKGAHFAVFPPDLVEPCILAGSRPGDTVLDPFNGSGTTGQVAIEHGRQYLGIELNPDYLGLTRQRLESAIERSAAATLQASLFHKESNT